MIEMKIILAMTVRKYDFSAAFAELDQLKGDGTIWPNDNSRIQEVYRDEAYQVKLGSAKPREGMPVRVTLRKAE
jgi:hypothetical protein